MTRRKWLAFAAAPLSAANKRTEPQPKPEKKQAKAPEVLHVPFWMDAPGSLEAKVNGTAARILSQRNPEDDLLLLLVVDFAGDLAYVDPARQALTESIEKLPPNAWVALLRAQDGLRTLVDPSPGRDGVVQAIRDLGISGKAGLLETIETAAGLADALLDHSNVRVAVLYVTDSSIYNYREDYTNPVVNSSDGRDMSRRFPEGLIKEKIRQLEARLATKEAPVFIVHLAYSSDRLSEAYQTGLLSLATTTGAQATICRSLAEIPTAIQQAFTAITTLHYVSIELKAAAAAKQVDVTLTAPDTAPRHRTRFVLKGR